jgi:hypothetical protein
MRSGINPTINQIHINMNRSNRGRKPNKLNLISTSFLKSNGRALDAEKFADDKANTLALKIFRSQIWTKCLPLELCSQMKELNSIKNTKILTKEIIKSLSTSANSWVLIKNYYKSQVSFEARVCKDLKLKFNGREDKKRKTIEELVEELFSQLQAKKIKNEESEESEDKENRDDSTSAEFEELSCKTEDISPSQESNPSEPNYSFDEEQDDKFIFQVLDLEENNDLACSRTRN